MVKMKECTNSGSPDEDYSADVVEFCRQALLQGT